MALGLEAVVRFFVTDSAPALVHWLHLCCKTYVGMGEVSENPICLQGLQVHLEMSMFSSIGINFPVLLSKRSSNAVSCTAMSKNLSI